MGWTKEKYLDKINNSTIFDIVDKTSDEYQTELRYLQTKICEYFTYYNLYDKNYSLELMDAINDSVKYFDKSKGYQFISYLSNNVKRRINSAKAKENAQETRAGIKVGDQTQKEIRLILSIINNRGWSINDTDIVEKLASTSNLKQEKIKELLQTNHLASVLKDYAVNDDEELSIIESVSDNITPESLTISKANATEVLERVRNAIYRLSPSKQKVVSQIITLMLEEFDFERIFTIEELQSYSFFNINLYTKQQQQENKITDSDLAKMLNISKAYISKVKKELLVI